MMDILKKIRHKYDWWVISRVTILVLIIIAAGFFGFYSIHESSLDTKNYIDAVDYAREIQVLLQKQFQSWKRAVIQGDDQEIYRKEYHEFSRYSALIQDLLFNLKTTCAEFDGVPEKLRLLSGSHTKISYEFTSLLFLLNYSSNQSKDTIISRAAGKDEEILNSIDDIVADIKRISTGKISQINANYLKILVGVLIILVFIAALLSYDLVRKIITERFKLEKDIRAKSADLVEAGKRIKFSEERYRRIVDESKEIIFHLDESWNILAISRAVKEHLKIKPEKLYQSNFIDLIHEDPDSKIYSRELVRSKLDTFSKEGVPIKFKADFMTPHLFEPKIMDVRLEYINIEGKREVYGTASLSEEDTVQKYITQERLKFQISNSLMAAEDITFRTTNLLCKYVEPNRAGLIRMGFREILINAIEHGNLNIGFEEKTEATIKNEYLQLINERQKDRNYRQKKVMVDYSIDRDKIIFKVTDEGTGFDHGKIMNISPDLANSQMLAHGRGIHMAREIFDVLKYNDKGNQVLMVAYLSK